MLDFQNTFNVFLYYVYFSLAHSLALLDERQKRKTGKSENQHIQKKKDTFHQN